MIRTLKRDPDLENHPYPKPYTGPTSRPSTLNLRCGALPACASVRVEISGELNKHQIIARGLFDRNLAALGCQAQHVLFLPRLRVPGPNAYCKEQKVHIRIISA